MKRFESRTFWGLLLIVGGALFLMESLGLLTLDNIWPIIFAIPGVAFLYAFFTDRKNWWPVIPGLTLLGLGALIAFEQLFPEANDVWGAAIFLGSLGLSFLAVYIRSAARQWWAIIPAGVLGTIAILTGFEPYLADGIFAGLFMLGLGATFGLVYFFPTPAGRMKWAVYPASILGGIGVLTLISATWLSRILGPAAIIALGIYLILKRRDTWE